MAKRPPYEPPLITSDRFPLRLAVEQDRVPAGAEAEWEIHRFRERQTLTTLDLGGVRVALLGDDSPERAGGLAAVVREHWAEFEAAPGQPVDVAVSLRSVERQPFETPVAFAASAERDGHHLVKMRGLSTALVPAEGRGTALVERRAPLQDLSNLLRVVLWTFGPPRGRHLLHAGAVALPEGAVLLVGAAQSGKSTAARLAAPREVLTDDALLLHLDGDRVMASTVGLWGFEGSDGMERVRVPRTLPVAAFVSLAKAADNRLVALSRLRAALEVQCAASAVVKDVASRQAALGFAEAAASRALRFELAFSNRDGSFWELVEAAVTADATAQKR